MLKADIYLLPDAAEESLLRSACKLVMQIFEAGQKIFVKTSSHNQSMAIDKMLWAYPQNSFLPHCLYQEGCDIEKFPIQIGCELSNPHRGVLVILGGDFNQTEQKYSQIADFVLNTESDKIDARARYRKYKKMGASLGVHNL